MPMYLSQFAYTSDALAAMARKPEDREPAVRQLAEALGGRLHQLYFTFGEYDGVALWEFPDDATAVAAVMAAVSPGHLRASKTMTLLTPSDMLTAMKKAGGITFRGPAGQSNA